MPETLTCSSARVQITMVGSAAALWRYRVPGETAEHDIAPPSFEIDTVIHLAELANVTPLGTPALLRNGVVEYRFSGEFVSDPTLRLEVIFRVADDTPVVRFRYRLHSDRTRKLTKTHGHDHLIYGGISLANFSAVTEVRFSEFNELVHSFTLQEVPVADRQFENATRVMGPMLVAERANEAILIAYEHGSQVPDAFLHYCFSPTRDVTLEAVKGNYWHGQLLDPSHPYTSIWLQYAAAADETALAAGYRHFVLHRMSLNAESRKPYIFYNTWACQERNQAWDGADYLDSMTQERILQEIDVAHRMGIEVFVLDTGWYEKTGDWRVSRTRFSDDLRVVKAALDRCGMKLGLWFGPLHAALSSEMHAKHRECIMSWQGEPSAAQPIWETEASQNFCLVSRYADAFADELIRLVRDVGVTYFKWDAVGQYGCDDPGHAHGDSNTTATDRAESYAFQQSLAMVHIVDKLCEACPEAIVDFDITEGGRSVGLGFLAAGKYFLVNNGPYYANFDIPECVRNWTNIFVWPGPARPWICRTPLTYDKWIPSVLMLAHYLPDDPESSQRINIASLILGHNGIWGDLLSISPEGIARFGMLLGLYKQVREDITAATARITGRPGGSPEIYEKISDRGYGVVCIFASARGTYTYVTEQCTASDWWATEGVTLAFDAQGRAVLTCQFDEVGAIIVFFGVQAL
jgi:alpha-galactosidase